MVIEKKFINITLHKFSMEPSSDTDLFPQYALMASVLPLLPLPFSSISKPYCRQTYIRNRSNIHSHLIPNVFSQP